MKTKSLLYSLLLPLLFVGCSVNQDPDPAGAERIFDSNYAAGLRNYNDNKGFRVTYNDDLIMCRPYFIRLKTPAENVKLILAGCNQSGGELEGYKVLYNADGLVRDVIAIYVDGWEDPNAEVIEAIEDAEDAVVLKACKKWMNDPNLEGEHFTISRDESGNVTSVGSIYVPYGYTATYWIEEWGENFWISDTSGGNLAFLVQLEDEDKKGKSTVDYLYCDGHLVAELAYWNGVLIKALYYDYHGHFLGIKEERNIDTVFKDVYENCRGGSPFKWYLGTEWQ